MSGAMSLYLDLVRFLAAVTVFMTHAAFERFGGSGLAIGNHAHEAVMVFFVLSGFVIAYVVDQKEKTFRHYTVNRMARLYSVALPALLLVAVFDLIGGIFDPSLYSDYCCQYSYPVIRLAINALFLNEIWFESVRPFSNAPYWSLGYEFWYYVLFAGYFYFSGTKRYLVLLVSSLIAGPSILLLLPVWLMGVWLYRFLKNSRIREFAGWLLLIASVVGYGFYRSMDLHTHAMELTAQLFGSDGAHALQWSRAFWSDWFLGLLICMNFAGFSVLSNRVSGWLTSLHDLQLERAIRYFAGMTFSLYLFHYPLLQFLTAVSRGMESQWRNMVVTIVVFVLAGLLSIFTERKKGVVRRLLDRVARMIFPIEKRAEW
ncbi:MAG: acyltransferase [Mariprofundaceae bacterium]|nr:acyltransferase [Mariprofundaceae bacterium]